VVLPVFSRPGGVKQSHRERAIRRGKSAVGFILSESPVSEILTSRSGTHSTSLFFGAPVMFSHRRTGPAAEVSPEGRYGMNRVLVSLLHFFTIGFFPGIKLDAPSSENGSVIF